MLSLYLNMSFGFYFLGTALHTASIFFKHRTLPGLARLLMILGTLSLSCYMAARWYAASRPPFSNMFESLVLLSWAVAIAAIFIDIKYKIRNVAALTALMSLLTIGYASLLDRQIAPLLPALKSNWLTIHVLTCFIGYAALTAAFISSLVLLCRKKDDEKLDAVSYKLIAFGFLFLALGIISGAVWANSAWGTYWSWDPKETWSLITWFVYAIYLHARLTKGWRGKPAAWLAVIGFVAMLFTYFGVNYLLPGLHSYAD